MSAIKAEALSNGTLVIGAAATSPAESAWNAKSSSRKRKASTTGSRGIASLTPEQLAKKRANDRDAQRAIRERTKHQIETLEQKIWELQCQQPYQELQHVLRQKEAVEAENAEIKTRLTSILNLVQPLLADRQPDVTTPPRLADHMHTGKPSQGSDAVRYSAHPTLAPTPPYVDVPTRQSCSPVASTSSHTTWHTSAGPAQQSPAASAVTFLSEGSMDRQRALAPSVSAERLAYNFFSPSQPNPSHNMQQGRQGAGGRPLPADSHITLVSSHPMSPLQRMNPNIHGTPLDAALTLPYNILSTCPLDGLLLDFIAERRQRKAEGMADAEVIGPLYPSFFCLFRPERSIYTHPMSRFFTDILSTFPDVSSPPEQVAILYIMFLIMRWEVSPSQETYERLPNWVQPTSAQLYTPHPIWIDYLPWPGLRDKLVACYPRFPFDNFFIPFTTTVSLNWPYGPMNTLSAKPGSEELEINPVFEEHLRDLRNWSLGVAFAKAHPALADTVRIQEEPTR